MLTEKAERESYLYNTLTFIKIKNIGTQTHNIHFEKPHADIRVNGCSCTEAEEEYRVEEYN